MKGARLSLLALALAASCAGGGGEARIRLSLDGESCGGLSAGEIDLPCGGAIGLWALDAGGGILASRCVGFGSERSRLSEVPSILSEAGVALDVGGGQEVVFELAVYGPEAASCPRAGDGGTPLQLARSEPVKLTGSSPEIELLLECLAQAEACGGGGDDFVTVETTVLDLGTLQPASKEEVTAVEIAAAFAGDPDGEETSLDPLGDLAGSGGVWSGRIPALPAGSACLATLVSSIDGFDFLSCSAAPPAPDASEVATTGYFIRPEEMGLPDEGTIQALLQNGLVYGRVTSAAGEPLSAEQVQALDASYTVQFEADRFIAFRQDGATPHCCVQFAASGGDMGEAITEPVPVFPGVISTVHLTVP